MATRLAPLAALLLALGCGPAAANEIFWAGESYTWRNTSGSVACFRIPALVEAADDHLVAVAEARLASCSDETNKFLAIKTSSDGGLTWEKSLRVVEGTPTTRTWNPELAYDVSSGRLFLQFLRNRTDCQTRPGGCMAYQTHSDDNGQTWASPAMALSPFLGDTFANGVRPGPGRGVVLSRSPHHKGRVLFSGSYSQLNMTEAGGAAGPDGKKSKSESVDLVWYSDDGGATYKLSGARLKGVDETALVELADGSVLLNMRNVGAASAKVRMQSVSQDGGETWSKPEAVPSLTSPGCEGSILSVGSALLFSGPDDATERRAMTVRKSKDSGRTWEVLSLVYEGASAYSCLAGLRSSGGAEALLAYERGASGPYGNITLARIRV